jgi:hypothetical protein
MHKCVNSSLSFVVSGLDLDIAYKLLSTPNPNFQDEGQYQASFNHTAEIGLAYRF